MATNPPPTSGKGGIDLESILPFVMLTTPFLEAQNPGSGLGLAAGISSFQRERAIRRRQESQALLGLLSEADDENLETAIGALIDQGYDPKIVRAMAKASRAFVDPSRKAERAMSTLVDVPGIGQVTRRDAINIQLRERDRAAEAAQRETEFTRGQQAQLTDQAREFVLQLSLTPAVTRVPNGVARVQSLAQRLQAGEDPGKIIADAQVLAAEVGQVAAEQEHKPKRQEFLRNKLLAAVAGTQKVDLETLRKQMEKEGMVWGAELVAAQQALASKPPTVSQTEAVILDKIARGLPLTPGERRIYDEVIRKQGDGVDTSGFSPAEKRVLDNYNKLVDQRARLLQIASQSLDDAAKTRAMADIAALDKRIAQIQPQVDRILGVQQEAPPPFSPGTAGAPPFPPQQYRGQYATSPNGEQWYSDGTKWTRVAGQGAGQALAPQPTPTVTGNVQNVIGALASALRRQNVDPKVARIRIFDELRKRGVNIGDPNVAAAVDAAVRQVYGVRR